ncbi:MAG: crotonase/enoyl-CoA hydratase family protein [Pseudoxanthomonas sp.]|jgi:DSF synthase
MSTIEKFQRARDFHTIRTESSPDNNCHWLYMHHDAAAGARPCFRPQLLEEMWGFTSSITLGSAQERQAGRLRHFVLASEGSAFNLGGDLELFGRLIRSRDREHLLQYARRCIDGVNILQTGLGGDVRTIALLQGDALGGGLEMALACHTIVAEEGVEMGLPEVLFGLFPGMGAYSFLCKRVSPQLAERLVLDGVMYKSEDMYRMGVVDILVGKGQGRAAVQDLIRQQQRAPHAHVAMNQVRNISQRVSHDELMAITEVWVDTALALGDKSLRMMERIVRAQERRSAAHAA